MSVERPTVGRETILKEALQRIGEDIKLYPASFSLHDGNMTTKQEVYERFFGEEARYGTTRTVHSERRNISGWYERFPSLSHAQIDEILNEQIINLANAKILMHFKSRIEHDLRSAARDAKLAQSQPFPPRT